jgi:hypothetical protein
MEVTCFVKERILDPADVTNFFIYFKAACHNDGVITCGTLPPLFGLNIMYAPKNKQRYFASALIGWSLLKCN